MGYRKDAGTSAVAGQCPKTDYPQNEDGRLLNPICDGDGSLEPWLIPQDDRGHYRINEEIELVNLTNPYGHLHFAVGSGDDFHCFDYACINAGGKGSFIILDGTLNSETGSFIEGAGYEVMPINNHKEKLEAWYQACRMVDRACDWCGYNGVLHTVRGWNQSPSYFARCVAKALFDWEFKYLNKRRKITDRMMRFGSKTFDAVMNETIKEN